MQTAQTLSTAVLNLLTEFGGEKLTRALDTSTDPEGNLARGELLDALAGKFSTLLPQCEITEKRPEVLKCDVVRFQNKKEKWVAFIGLLNGYPYEIFTGVLDDEDGIALPKLLTEGYIVKRVNADGTKRYDFTFINRRGYKTIVEGLSERFNKEYWNYAKLISGVLRYRMPLTNVITLISSLQLENEKINTWSSGVVRALKKYVPNATEGAHALGDMPIRCEGGETAP